MKLSDEIARRRTFAIISHPDAGKTTLTEKFLLYGGAVQLAGSVTARANRRKTSSDWMELEKQRGISVSSTVLQFEYEGFYVNLLDTPGHKDFSEDTYRVLTAVDAVIMVIDAGKGIESQTRKLFEICRRRGVPIFTFMNKCDRPTLEPLELLDELERVLGISAYALSWPLGNGERFKGVFDRLANQIHTFERVSGGAYRAPVSISDISDPDIREKLDSESYDSAVHELEILNEAGSSFDPLAVLRGELTPVMFGSASNNFGVQLLLDMFLKYSAAPGAHKVGERTILPEEEKFSGFVFKIQANMDPKHRDHIAFIRICSGVFRRDMTATHVQSKKTVRLSSSHKLLGQDRETVDVAYPGDVIGLVGHSSFGIGDTITEDPTIVYDEIPRFVPECFAMITGSKTEQFKRFRQGLDQLIAEGVVQPYYDASGFRREPILGAVGPLQFEVMQFRLESEYTAQSRLDNLALKMIRWLPAGTSIESVKGKLNLPGGSALVTDRQGLPALLFPEEWAIRYFTQNNPGIDLLEEPPVQ